MFKHDRFAEPPSFARPRSRWLVLAAVVLALCFRLDPLVAQAPTIAGVSEVSNVGDVAHRVQITLPAMAYNQAKAEMPSLAGRLRDFKSSRADIEVAPGASARWDDATLSAILELTELGGARNLGAGQWEIPIDEEEMEFVGIGTDGGRPAIFFYHHDESFASGRIALRLPARSSELEWDAERRRVLYRLGVPAGSGSSRVEVELKVKDRLMSGVYKVYGLGSDAELGQDLAAQWVAKAVVRNRGTHMAKNLRVRYRVSGYSEWSTWQKFPEVLPGQTVVSTYYPVLDPAIASLRSDTPSDVLMEWQYDEADGRARADSDGRRIKILGAHDMVLSNVVAGESLGTLADVYSNAPLLAAFVSRDDAAVREFGALANKRAGGVQAETSDESTLRLLKGLYELFLVNDITYQSPASVVEDGASFDPKVVQSLKYPRDVLRDRSGTCIDLAILYLSALHSVGGGLNAALALVPGHAFPVVQLPSGQVVGIETTMVGGGAREGGGAAPFEAALEAGSARWQHHGTEGSLLEVDFRELWQKGISNPELEPLPPNILQQWGIREGGAVSALQAPAVHRPQMSAAGASSPVGFFGSWQGLGSSTNARGQVTIPAALEIVNAGGGRVSAVLRLEGQVATPQGSVKVFFEGLYHGELDDEEELTLRAERRVFTAEGMPPQAQGPGKLKLDLAHGRLTGREGSFSEGWTELAFERP